MAGVFSQLSASDPSARERLRRFLQRARILVGSGGDPLTSGEQGTRTGMRFPGDALLFGGVVAFLTLCCHVSLVHLVEPELAGARWPVGVFIFIAATVAVGTWKLGQLRDAPRTLPESLPDPAADSPLVELHDFAQAMKRELETSARLQRILANALYASLLIIGCWALVLLMRGHTRFAELLLMAAALTASFVTLNWRPYGVASRRARLAGQAKQMAATLTEQIHRLGGESVASTRTAEEWSVVRDALLGALPLAHASAKRRGRRLSRKMRKRRASAIR